MNIKTVILFGVEDFNMRKLLKDLYEAWLEAREAYVKARMIDGHWL